MAIYKEGKRLVKLWKGAEKIARVYKGSELIFGYPPETLLFEQSTAGTYTLTLDYDVKCHIEIVGGGGGGWVLPAHSIFYGGGSGAYIHGEAIIPAGTYEIVVGGGGNGQADGGDSSFYNQIAGKGHWGSSGSGGTPTITLSGLTGENGNGGSNSGGGKSAYDNTSNGYGAGGYGAPGKGKSGYVKIQTV